MICYRKIFSIAVCCSFLFGCFPNPLKSADAAPLKILAVGNSFTNNATRYLPEIVEVSAGRKLLLRRATIGGGPLDQHWRAVAAHEADSDNPKGKIYAGQSLKDRLQMENWDIVTIQQNSFKSRDIATYRPYAANLCDYIRKHAPGAEIVIHQTWAYRVDDPLFKKADYSQSDMYRELTAAYATIAKELSVKRIIPVGRAFQEARSDANWRLVVPDPKFDYARPVFPELPRQVHSLNVGWRWKDKKKFSYDGHHANVHGEYLAAAVWFEFFLGKDVRGNSFLPPSVTKGDAIILQKIANLTVKSTAGLQVP